MGVTISDVVPSNGDCIFFAMNLHLLGAKSQRCEQLLRVVANALQIPIYNFLQESPTADVFRGAIQEITLHAERSTRTRLLLAGAYLDELVTTASLIALEVGLDVYLLYDITACKDPKHEQVFLHRLLQAGVVPTTLGQCLYQWSLVPENETVRPALADCSIELLQLSENSQVNAR